MLLWRLIEPALVSFFWQLIFMQLVNKFPAFLGGGTHSSTKSLPVEHILSVSLI
jgi:hypothetical protein